jgi:hypothetical protein
MPLVPGCPPEADRWSLREAKTPMVCSGMEAGVDQGDRYWPEVVEEVPEDVEAGAAGGKPSSGRGVRPYGAGTGGKPRFSHTFPPSDPPSPG